MSVDSDKATCKPREKTMSISLRLTAPLSTPSIAAGIAAATAAVTAMARRESSSSGMAEEDVI